uniref:Uncharacterized protein n=1 Tax=Romanomermis culicivorax TaxID=13658 RepID=A0A915KQ00_ROMCU
MCCSPSMLGGVEKFSTTARMLSEQIFCARGSARRANIHAPSMLGEQLARRCARRTSPSTALNMLDEHACRATSRSMSRALDQDEHDDCISFFSDDLRMGMKYNLLIKT